MTRTIKFTKRILSSQRGQALPIVLALLAIGSLTIAANLNYATTSAQASRIVRDKTAGLYAASAGVEDAIWSLRNGLSPPTELGENLNNMAVTINTDNQGTRTLVLTGWTTLSLHYDYVSVSKSVTWDAGAYAYRYTVNVTWQAPAGTPKIFIQGLGVRIPVGYSYQASPAPSGMSTNAPTVSGDIDTGYIFEWSWSGGSRPYIWDNDGTLVQTQTFYISGTGGTNGTYSWVTTDRGDVGTVGEITGTIYRITATARRPQDGRVMAQILANDIMMVGGTTYVFSWQIQ